MHYVTLLSESAYGGTNVLRVTATDADSGINRQLTYSVRDINDTDGSIYFQVISTQATTNVCLTFN